MRNLGPLYFIVILLSLCLIVYLFVLLLKHPPSFGLNLDDIGFYVPGFLSKRNFYPFSNGSILLIFLLAGIIGWTLRGLRGQATMISLLLSLILSICLWLLCIFLISPLFSAGFHSFRL